MKTFPAGAEVLRDGIKVSVTPCELYIDRYDTIDINIRMEGYHDFRTLVTPIGRDTLVVFHRMIHSFGYISVDSDPYGAIITIDTAVFADKVSRLKVQPGVIKVSIHHPQRMNVLRSVITVQNGEHVRLAGFMDAFSHAAVIRSMIVPGLGQFVDRNYLKGLIYFSAVTASAVAGISAESQYLYNLNRYRIEYRTAVMSTTPEDFSAAIQRSREHYDTASKYQKLRNTAFISMGILFAANILDAAINHHETTTISVDQREFIGLSGTTDINSWLVTVKIPMSNHDE
ncbi:MAG: DUF5683 domain-containing protein [Bacteroidota bacterium]